MVCKNILITFLFSIFLSSNHCYYIPSLLNKRTIEIGNFSDNINISGKSISFEFKKKFEDFILKHTPWNFVKRGGDIHLDGNFIDYKIIKRRNSKLEVIKMTVKIYCKDNLNPEKNWEKYFDVIESISNRENYPLENSIIVEKIINNLIFQLYNKIFNNW
ncbi:hypothetical protein DM815_01005 [Blattabacterium sp. (Cryptocercus kyebangensis)]|uniref:hypothetical protein n=1 Tax=Blattabacterium sp. (Cryptocercus kyebangensis) TaxID=298656 RepID=UPI000D7BF9FA|nr:hypothetical protein [Blattabacterium sp. (Cryptocercus kyebangensis)]AWU43647.1 hypothetical protein DM815_01005 [Blattabacterium sp. (Cryptocercus kyebangensis)]